VQREGEQADLVGAVEWCRYLVEWYRYLCVGLETPLFERETRGKTETMLFGEVRTHVLERSQLHRILADNTCVFGEEFALTGDDQGLTAVLRAHSKLLGDKIVVDEPVALPGGRRGIIDLMFSKIVKSNRQDEIQHLVVELKRPTEKIDAEEITQIKRYAQAVYSDSRFQNLEVRWDFWLVGVDLSEFAQNEAKMEGLPPGVIWRGFNGRVTAWCKSWAEGASGE
jgi:hypothetical protein